MKLNYVKMTIEFYGETRTIEVEEGQVLDMYKLLFDFIKDFIGRDVGIDYELVDNSESRFSLD